MARSTLYEDFLASVKNRGVFTQGQRAMVACSGGPDSVALLDIMTRYAPSVGIKVFCCHLNHCLRGADSDEDERFVQKLAKSRSIEIFTATRDVAALARERGLSVETAAREARYEFFAEAAKKLRCSVVVTAHTASDNVETFLQRLIEGAGAEGLSGIPSWRLLDAARKVHLWRPLLFAYRSNIEGYCASRGLEFRTDKTNLEPTYLRNRIRLRLLPLLREFNPSIEQALARAAMTVSDLYDYVGDDVERVYRSILYQPKPPILVISIYKLLECPAVTAREAVKYVLINAGVEWRELKYSHVDAVFALAMSRKASARLDMPGDVSVRREYEFLYVGRESDFAAKGIGLDSTGPDDLKYDADWSAVLVPPGTVKIPSGLGEITVVDEGMPDIATFAKDKTADEEIIDADAVRGVLCVRFARNGDRFRPLGAPGVRKLQDVFTDARVPAPQRRLAPVVCDDKGIIWVVGHRIADRVKITDKTTKPLALFYHHG